MIFSLDYQSFRVLQMRSLYLILVEDKSEKPSLLPEKKTGTR
jgi:hypothetical protein